MADEFDPKPFRTDPRSVAKHFELVMQSLKGDIEWLVRQVEQYRNQYDDKCKLYIEQRDRADALQAKLTSQRGAW